MKKTIHHKRDETPERDEVTARRLKLAKGRAVRKADNINAKTQAEIPLFADQVEPAKADDLYRHWQLIKAGGVEASGEIMGDMIWRDWTVGYLVHLAREAFPPDVFAKLETPKFGYPVLFWTDRLTTMKPVVLYQEAEREYGPLPIFDQKSWTPGVERRLIMVMSDRLKLNATASFPPPGWVPPYTRDALDKLLQIAAPADHPGAVNPLVL